ncbi:MAG TPA: TonB-dependent receptor [Bacteroidia bacterium]|nr:TonB-dependent receptor [Bacteroidia bacterium]HRG52461.1 TonB-dependent receptor [Bacteroidia bacterium]
MKKRILLVLLMAYSSPILAFGQTDTILSVENLKNLSLEELMNIQVFSVSKSAEKLTEVASAVQVITSEDIRRSGVTTLPEALRLAQNLQVAKVNASQWAISARGFNNVLASKLLVMIDGRVVYTPLYAGVFWDVQNVLLEDVDRIEVISGPGGALWGANAVNGVINIITKNSKKTQGLFIEAGSGNQKPWFGNLRYGGKIGDNIHYRIYGTAFKEASTLLANPTKSDSTDGKDEWSIGQTGFRIDWQASSKDVLTLQSDFYDGYPNPDGKAASAVVAMGGNALARWTHTFSEKSDLTVHAYYDNAWRDFRNGFTENLKTYDLDAQYRFQLGKRQEIVWGGNLRLIDHKTTSLPLFYLDPERKLLHIYSTFLQDKITILKEKLHLTLGCKFEHNVYTGMEYAPSARVAYTLPKRNNTIWASASRAVRTPSRIDKEFNLYLFPGFPIIVGSDFRAETVWAYELGWRSQFSDNFSFSASTFYNVYDKLRSAEPSPTPTTFPFKIGNGVEGNTYGVELATTFQPLSWWRIKGGYTFLEKKLKVKPDSKDLNKGTVESDDPNNQFLIQSTFDFPKQIESGFVLRYVDVLTNKYVPSYFGLDIQIGWKFTKWLQISVVGQNLLDDHHPEFVPSSPSPREITRSFYGKITARI